MNVFDSKIYGRVFLDIIDGEIYQIKAILLRNFKRICIKTVAVMVLLPAFIEAWPAPKEVPPKLCNSCAMFKVGGQKQVSGGNGHSTHGFEGGKFAIESGAKSGTSCAESNKSLNSKSTKNSHQRNCQISGPSGDVYFQAILLAFIAVGLPMIPVL